MSILILKMLNPPRRKELWNAMSNWRLYSSKLDQINRQVGSPWTDFFSETFSKAANILNADRKSIVERVAVPAFYFSGTCQQGIVEITNRHKTSKFEETTRHHLFSQVQFGEVVLKEFNQIRPENENQGT